MTNYVLNLGLSIMCIVSKRGSGADGVSERAGRGAHATRGGWGSNMSAAAATPQRWENAIGCERQGTMQQSLGISSNGTGDWDQ